MTIIPRRSIYEIQKHFESKKCGHYPHHPVSKALLKQLRKMKHFTSSTFFSVGCIISLTANCSLFTRAANHGKERRGHNDTDVSKSRARLLAATWRTFQGQFIHEVNFEGVRKKFISELDDGGRERCRETEDLPFLGTPSSAQSSWSRFRLYRNRYQMNTHIYTYIYPAFSTPTRYLYIIPEWL